MSRGLTFHRQIASSFQSLGDVVIPLERVGMVAIRGKNLDDASAQENGVGKTSLLDSIVCTLYGRIPRYARPVRGSQIINRHGKDGKCTLQLNLSVGTNSYAIYRSYTKKAHKLRLIQNGKDISEASIPKTQDKIVQLVGTYQAFLNSIMFGRGVISRFVKADSVERGEIIASLVMDVEQLDDMRKKIEKRYTEKQSNLSSVQEKLESAKVVCDSKKQDFQSKREDLQHIQLQNKDQLKSLKPPTLVKDTTTSLSKQIQQLTLKIDRLKRKQDNQRDRMNVAAGQLKEVQLSYDVLTIASAIDEACCPVCSAKLSEHKRNNFLHRFQKNIKELQIQSDRQKSKVYVLRDKIIVLETKSRKLKAELDNIKNKLSKYDHAKMAFLNIKAVLIEQEAKAWERLTHAKVAYLDSCHSVKRAKQLCQEFQQEVKDLIFLRKAFSNKGIMAEVVKTVCPKLTSLSQQFVTQFLGGGYHIEFVPELVTFRGEDRLSFNIHASVAKGGSEYAACSDGEQERIDTCVGLALRYLVSSRFNQQVNLLAFDERFSGLDALGAEKVMELITEEAKKQSSVLVITHQENLQQFFEKQWTVVKENGIAKLESD